MRKGEVTERRSTATFLTKWQSGFRKAVSSPGRWPGTSSAPRTQCRTRRTPICAARHYPITSESLLPLEARRRCRSDTVRREPHPRSAGAMDQPAALAHCRR
jgi:hypothetical protein